MARFGLLPGKWLYLTWPGFVSNFQIWRGVTAIFFFPLSPQTGFKFLINLYFLYSYSLRLETGLFDGRPADYLLMLVFNWLMTLLACLFLDIPFLMVPLVLSCLYVWCQCNRDTIVNFWFGTQFKAMYLPWVLFAFGLIISGGGVEELIGILVGHMYFFLMFKYPQDFGGPSLLSTPNIFYSWFPNRRGGVSGYGQAPASTAAPRGGDGGGGGAGFGGGHAWGQGRRLDG
eukprot:TRINITY_DN36417_c0_g1_i1.p1 TRINITY_DN36417_c0_g1~~TRINITY_DN36417_c0_g1_i1.p1  ORF type:complete len:230 (+),score=50.48 TRINITY_DN36417_c0_g1_i1:130-819(+)